jgi:pimeloyl-ACP methyl ester carboxylesterase
MVFESGSVNLSGVRLAYLAAGPLGAPPVVLLHALGSQAATWEEVAAALSDRFRVYAPDLRGHGESGRPGAYSLELMRDDVVEFIDGLGAGPVTLVGQAMGAMVAFLLVEEHPERVSRLVIEDSTPPYRPEQPVQLPEGQGDDVFVAILRQLNDPDPAWWDRTSGIKVPTLMIAGGPDSHIPQDRISAVAQRIPECRVLTIPVGHDVHSSAPEDFNAALLGFLKP